MSHIKTKPTKWQVRPVKTQISLGVYPDWSESSLSAQWVAKDPRFLHADSEDSDQTERMPRLIWVFTGPICYFAGFVTMRLKGLVGFIFKDSVPEKFYETACSRKPYPIIRTASQENLSSGFSTKVDTNRPAQLQKLARGLKFWI